MNRLPLFALLTGLLITAASCGPNLRPFTQQLYDQNRWSEDDLRHIQFYLSNDIVLRRELSNGSSEITRGQIKMVNGKRVEEILIRKGTPGVFLFSPKDKRFAMSFEEGGDQRFLIFGPSPKAGERYVLLASEWGRRDGTVTYEGVKYQVDAESAYASLLVDLKKLNKTSINSRTASGRKIE